VPSDDSFIPFDKGLPFPVMNKWFDTGEDLKNKLKDIVSRNRFRNRVLQNNI
jgi:hypothetical protein